MSKSLKHRMPVLVRDPWPKIMILIPTNKDVEPETTKAVREINYPNFDVLVNVKRAKYKSNDNTVDLYRNCTANMNVLRKKALMTNAEYFLTLDSDIIPPRNTLIDLVLHHFDVIGGWYRMINAPYYVTGKWVGDNLFSNFIKVLPNVVEVDVVGHGCMLLSRRVLEKLKFEPGVNLWCRRPGETRDVLLGACGIWGNRCTDAGFRLFMNGRVVCGHKNRATGEIVK